MYRLNNVPVLRQAFFDTDAAATTMMAVPAVFLHTYRYRSYVCHLCDYIHRLRVVFICMRGSVKRLCTALSAARSPIACLLGQRKIIAVACNRSEVSATRSPAAAAAAAATATATSVHGMAEASGEPISSGKRRAVRIGTHSGTFHCDEALGCFMLKQTSQFRDCAIVRCGRRTMAAQPM